MGPLVITSSFTINGVDKVLYNTILFSYYYHFYFILFENKTIPHLRLINNLSDKFMTSVAFSNKRMF